MNHKIFFFTIQKPEQKVDKIIQSAHYHFGQGEKMLFLTPSLEVTKYVDELLWKEPKNSFLPHSTEESNIILISPEQKWVQSIHYIFNLTAHALFLQFPLKVVYEFADFTSEEKKMIYQKKMQSYQEKGFFIQNR